MRRSKPWEMLLAPTTTLVVSGVVLDSLAYFDDAIYRDLRVTRVLAGAGKAGVTLKVDASYCAELDDRSNWGAGGEPMLVALERVEDGWECVATHPLPEGAFWLHVESFVELLGVELPASSEGYGPLLGAFNAARKRAQARRDALIAEVRSALKKQACELPSGSSTTWILWPDGRREPLLELMAQDQWAHSVSPAMPAPCLRGLFDGAYRGARFEGGAALLTLSGGAEGSAALWLCGELCGSLKDIEIVDPALPAAPRPDDAASEEWGCYAEGLAALERDRTRSISNLRQRVYCAMFLMQREPAQALLAKIKPEDSPVGIRVARVLNERPRSVDALRQSWTQHVGPMSDRDMLWTLSSAKLPQLLALSPLRLHAQAMLWGEVYPARRAEPLRLLYVAQVLAPEVDRIWIEAEVSRAEAAHPAAIPAAKAAAAPLLKQHAASLSAIRLRERLKQQSSQLEANLKREAEQAEQARLEAARSSQPIKVEQVGEDTTLRDALIVAIAIASLIATALLIRRTSR